METKNQSSVEIDPQEIGEGERPKLTVGGITITSDVGEGISGVNREIAFLRLVSVKKASELGQTERETIRSLNTIGQNQFFVSLVQGFQTESQIELIPFFVERVEETRTHYPDRDILWLHLETNNFKPNYDVSHKLSEDLSIEISWEIGGTEVETYSKTFDKGSSVTVVSKPGDRSNYYFQYFKEDGSKIDPIPNDSDRGVLALNVQSSTQGSQEDYFNAVFTIGK